MYDLYFLRLYRYLLVAAFGNEILAQEVVQETMIRVARKVHPMDSEADFWRWLTTVARNVLRDQVRRQKRYRGMLDRLSDWFRFKGEVSMDDERDINQHYQLILDRSMATLSESDRHILMQKYFGDHSVKQIAEALGTTPKAVESKLTRLRSALKNEVLNQLTKGDAHGT